MKLTNVNIDEAAELIFKDVIDFCGDKKEANKARLMVEEILLGYQAEFGEECEFKLISRKRLARHQIVVSVNGVRFNPLDNDSDENEVFQTMLGAFGTAPFWSYQGGQNTITYFTKKERRRSTLTSLAFAIGLGLLAGFGCTLLPDAMRDVIALNIVGPLFDAFMNVISCIAGPLIFMSIAWGIYCIGDVTTVEFIGKKMIGRFLLMSFSLVLISMLLVLPFFNVVTGGSGNLDLSTLYQMILDIIPNNIITPFAEGNTLQIIYLAICFGLGVLILGKKASAITEFTQQLNYLVQLIMDFISGLISAFVFMSLFSFIVGGTFFKLAGITKLIPVMLIGCIFPMVFYVIYVCVTKRVSPIILIHKQLPSFLIALTTASSSAAFSANITCCTKKLGIDRKIANFGVPLGQVIFAIGTAMSFVSIGLCMADIFAIDITPKWLSTMFIMAFVLGIATPPIPGGSMACFTIFAGQLGLPNEAVSICVAISVITDFVATAVNLFCLQLELTELGGRIGLLDIDVLRKAA